MLAVMASTAVSFTARAADLSFVGYARAIEGGALLYIESHLVSDAGTPREQRVVLYRCPRDESYFARKQLTYSELRTRPTFTLDDARTGYREGLRSTDAALEVFHRDATDQPLRTRPLSRAEEVVADAGFDEFVRARWNDLDAGRTVRFPFLVPSRREALTFKVKKHHDTTVENAPASVIRLNLGGWLGYFLPHIDVTYRKSDRQLLRYLGLVNVRDAKGDNLTAQIDFPIAERREGPVDLDAALTRPLVKRCSDASAN